MDILDFLGSMGLGLIIVLVIAAFLVFIMFLGYILPGLLMILGQFLYLFIIIIAIGAVIYFIGKFAKGLIRMR